MAKRNIINIYMAQNNIIHDTFLENTQKEIQSKKYYLAKINGNYSVTTFDKLKSLKESAPMSKDNINNLKYVYQNNLQTSCTLQQLINLGFFASIDLSQLFKMNNRYLDLDKFLEQKYNKEQD
jgi:hypothetical protein